MTGGPGAGPEQELEARKWGLNPDGQQREAMGNGEKPALWLTSGGGWWPAHIPALSKSICSPVLGFPGSASGKNPPANAGDARDLGLTPGSGKPPGGGHGNPLQSSCLESPVDRGAWRAAVHGVTESSLKRPGTHARLFPLAGHCQALSRPVGFVFQWRVGRRDRQIRKQLSKMTPGE